MRLSLQIFGWVTPSKHDFVAQTAFEMHKARYWAGPALAIATSVGEALDHVYGLIDTDRKSTRLNSSHG